MFSLVARATRLRADFDEANFDFIKAEGDRSRTSSAPWFGTLFWLIGAIALFAAALGISNVSRLVADVLHRRLLPGVRALDGEQALLLVVWGIIGSAS